MLRNKAYIECVRITFGDLPGRFNDCAYEVDQHFVSRQQQNSRRQSRPQQFLHIFLRLLHQSRHVPFTWERDIVAAVPGRIYTVLFTTNIILLPLSHSPLNGGIQRRTC